MPEVDAAFVRRIAPGFRALRAYSRLKVDGIEHVPTEGGAILAANHTGWLGLDYAFTALSIYDGIGRVPRGLVHAAWFRARATADVVRRLGLVQVSKDALRDLVHGGELAVIFPEGEKGAFRPGADYALEMFARGFIRVAMATGRPVVPVAILGGEEANPVGRRIESYEQLLGLEGGLPVPKNLLPRPVKWRIRFLPPVVFDKAAEPDDRQAVHAACDDVRGQIQRALVELRAQRGNPWI